MTKSIWLLCISLWASVVSAKPFEFSASATETPAALASATRTLATQVIAVYRDNDRPRYLDTLFRLQLVAGLYTDGARSLYENFIHPITILTALPLAMIGGLLALLLFGTELNIFSFVGLILLVGLVKKNGIIMVDFALQLRRDRNLSAADAIVESCIVRFRPIMMTTVAAIIGTLPIAMSSGMGAEARRPLGIAIVGGLVFSQLLTLYVTPALYVAVEHLTAQVRPRHAQGHAA